jgi:uncharacterized membrane protein YjfL (UPF0719 family)
MDRPLLIAALMLEALVLVWLAKQLWGVVLRRNVDQELTHHDNPAAAITLSGYFLGVFIALSGVLAAPSRGLVEDLLSTGAFGLAGVLVLFASLFGAPFVGGVKLGRDIIENHNVGAAMVLFANFVATGLIYSGAVMGEGAGVMAWVTLFAFQLLGQVTLAAMAHLFEFITPYDLHAEITEKRNTAAAIGYAGALVAIGMILHNAVSGDFVSWSTDLRSYALYCLPLLLLWPVRKLVVDGVMLSFKNLNHEIAVDRNVGAGLIEASVYVGFALLFMMAA